MSGRKSIGGATCLTYRGVVMNGATPCGQVRIEVAQFGDDCFAVTMAPMSRGCGSRVMGRENVGEWLRGLRAEVDRMATAWEARERSVGDGGGDCSGA